MDEADEERIELRLLTDPTFSEEFDAIVDEIADQYVGNELQGEERKRVEQYFLRSSERQNKLRFANELLERAALERGPRAAAAAAVAPREVGIFERTRLFWAHQSFFTRWATTFASIIIVVGVVMLAWPGTRISGNYASINLSISSSDRAAGSDSKPVKLEPGSPGIRISLTLPEQVPQTKSYRVELVQEGQAARNLPIDQQTDRSLMVTLPADEIRRGSYAIRVYALNPEGGEQRIHGSYLFSVEQ